MDTTVVDTSKSQSMLSGTALIVVAVLLLAIIAVSNPLLRGLRLDLTDNSLYTLSEGTKSVLGQIDEPINLYFFFSREAAQGIPQINTYGQRVQEMLQEMSEAADGGLQLQVIDPEPFSDDEDRAVAFGVRDVPLGDGSQLYFGLAASNAVGETEVIPFFQTGREELLEYELSRMVYQLSQVGKPVVGVLSTLSIDGGFDPQRRQALPPWTVVDQLRQFFELRTLENDVRVIPDDVEVLMLVHPAGLQAATLYAVDQFVLGGGRALVFVDAYAQAAAPAPGDPAPPAFESAPTELLSAWGVKLREGQVLSDAGYALQVSSHASQRPVYHYGVLAIPAAAINQDDVVTSGLRTVNVAFSGVLEPIEDAVTEFEPLLSSSAQSMTFASSKIFPGMQPASLQRDFSPGGKTYTLAARLRGKVSTAFPDGAPEGDAAAEGEASQDESAQDEVGAHIAESSEPINVVLVADTDLLSDQLWVRVQNFFGQRIATPWADNADFVVNAVDNLLGSSDLIGIRSRASHSRPFHRVAALERDADRRFRDKEEELQTSLRDTERKLAELQSEREDGSAVILSAEQRDEIQRFQQDKLRIRKDLRDVRHQLGRDIERLGTALKFVNIALVPLVLLAGVFIFRLLRRRPAVQQAVNV